jgi:hypothetical protein
MAQTIRAKPGFFNQFAAKPAMLHIKKAVPEGVADLGTQYAGQQKTNIIL